MIVVLFSTTAFAGDAAKFYVEDPANRNTVTFKSSAPLEDIVGTTNQITGYLNFNPDNPTEGGQGQLTVPVASLNTGIPMRDEHLRSANWLNAEKYSDIILNISSITKAELVKEMDNSKTFDLTTAGDFTLHGITKQINFTARVTYLEETEMTKMRLPGNLLAVRTEFSVPLDDFNITGPENMKIIGAKIGENIDIEVSLFASTSSPAMAQKK